MSPSSEAPALDTLSSLQQLSPCVYLHDPINSVVSGEITATSFTQSETPTTIPQSSAPKLIILSMWMTAHPHNIFKYVSGYQDLYPTSRIIVIRSSSGDWLWRSTNTRCRRVDPAVSAILAFCTATKKSDPEILLHLFSNGGSHQSTALLTAYGKTMSSSLPPHVKILDSCPGRGTFAESLKSLSAPLPRIQPLRAILVGILYVLLGIYCLVCIVLGMPDAIERVRQILNDRELFENETRRCYIYSDADDMVSWRDIEAHAEDARQKGFVVQTEKFQGSAHCQHIRVEGGKYWGIVNDVWRGGSSD